MQVLAARPQHFPATVGVSRSQVRLTPHDVQTEPRSPQAVSLWEVGATQVPVSVQQPRQLAVPHLLWQMF